VTKTINAFEQDKQKNAMHQKWHAMHQTWTAWIAQCWWFRLSNASKLAKSRVLFGFFLVLTGFFVLVKFSKTLQEFT